MKKSSILILFALIYFSVMSIAQTREDSLSIEKACRNYVEGWATGDFERVSKGVSPELVKRTISKDKDGISFTNNMSASLLSYVTKMNKEGVKGNFALLTLHFGLEKDGRGT